MKKVGLHLAAAIVCVFVAQAVGAARDAFEAVALAVPGVRLNPAGAPRGVKHSNLRVAGADGETVLLALDDLGVPASAGSACPAGRGGPRGPGGPPRAAPGGPSPGTGGVGGGETCGGGPAPA